MNEPADDDPLVRLALEGVEVESPESPASGLDASQGSANLVDTLELAEVVATVVDLLTP
jgi:hypothetical protein